ncbi:MAG: phosphatidylglycerophosphatase A family protein [Terriglobales bacterium]
MIATSTEHPSPTTAADVKAPAWAWVVGTFFGAGFGRPGPGTWASVATAALWLGLARFASPTTLPFYAIATAAIVTLIGIPAATRVARALGRKDPSQVVIDEVAGQMIALIGVPLNWHNVLAALILFRAFDITKPFPIRRLEHLPEGTGIMLDDVGAGLYALAIMQLLQYFGVLR